MIPLTALLTTPTSRAGLALVVALSSSLAVGACDSGASEAAPPIDAETYVGVMAELADLRRFPPPGQSTEERTAHADSARAAILDRHGVTADELLAFAEIVGSDPARMVEVTEGVVAISDSLARERTGAGRAAPDSLRELWGPQGTLDSAAADSPAAPASDSAFDPATDSAAGLPMGVERRERLRELQRRHGLRGPDDAPTP